MDKFLESLDLLKTFQVFNPMNENIVIYIKNKEGKIVFVSQGYLEQFPNVIGKTDFDLYSEQLALSAKLDDDYVMRSEKCLSVLEETRNKIDPNEKHFIKTVKLPLYDKAGEVVGIIGVSEHVTNSVEEKELYKSFLENYKDQLNTDFLTNLFNKRYFEDLLMEYYNRYMNSQRVDQSFDLFYIDLDNFKKVNDKHGHEYGDKYLKTFAQIMKNLIADSKIQAFRIGGDEFAIISFEETGYTKFLLEKVKKELLEIMPNVKQSFSYGYSNSQNCISGESMKVQADRNLYETKKEKKVKKAKK